MEISKEQVSFLKSNLRLLLNAKSIDEVVGMSKILGNYMDLQWPEPVELWLLSPGDVQNKIGAIKEVRHYLGLGLKEAKDLVEQNTAPIYKGDNPRLALELHSALQKYAKVEIRGASPSMQVLFGSGQ